MAIRNGEAAGLRVEDIGEDVTVPVRAYEGKSVKNREARGTLPIHAELLAMGFLGYHRQRHDR